MILDTNALSAFGKGNPKVRELIAAATGPFLPVVVLGEFRFGLMSARDRDKRMGWLRELTRHWVVLEILDELSIRYAEIRNGLREKATPIPSNDTWIAALALQHGQPILSNDTHFDLVPGIVRVHF